MKHIKLTSNCFNSQISLFEHDRGEAQAILVCTNQRLSFVDQLAGILRLAGETSSFLDMKPVFLRYFLSDATNQALLLPKFDYATTIVQQPPLNGTKVAVLLILEQNPTYQEARSGIFVDNNQRVLMGDTPVSPANSYGLTVSYLENLEHFLCSNGANLLNNCLRTWFFVRDVDMNYNGLVEGRNAMFDRYGLNSNTHFISSTGIQGNHSDPNISVCFNAVADMRLRPQQMQILRGLSHLNPTIEYGVAFERGTAVDYADRRHVYISGTASINNKGEIVYPGDIVNQCSRMLENIEVLLCEADCIFDDVAHFIVYLRDIADSHVVESIFKYRFPEIPFVLVYAPVCRPGWLIEAECMAIKEIKSEFDVF